jgi:hypothetical protein
MGELKALPDTLEHVEDWGQDAGKGYQGACFDIDPQPT